MSDDTLTKRRTDCLECGEELWSQLEEGGICLGCQGRFDDCPRPEDADNDPDQMLNDGDPGEP